MSVGKVNDFVFVISGYKDIQYLSIVIISIPEYLILYMFSNYVPSFFVPFFEASMLNR